MMTLDPDLSLSLRVSFEVRSKQEIFVATNISSSTMLALVTLIHLFAVPLAVALCHPVTDPILNLADCNATVLQMPNSAIGLDFHVDPLGNHVPGTLFTAGGDPTSPLNLPRSFIVNECQVTVTMRNGFTGYYAIWAQLRIAAARIVQVCVVGVPGVQDGGPPGRGGNHTYGRMQVEVTPRLSAPDDLE